VKGRREGFGTMLYSSGNYYEGEWVADKVSHSVRLSTVLFCTVLYCTVLYCTVLYCTVLYCSVVSYLVLYILYILHILSIFCFFYMYLYPLNYVILFNLYSV
jgi:hypothetical protein